MIDHDIAAELDALAQAIARMRPPQNHRPEAFHEDRSELASRARRLAERCRTGQPSEAADVPAPIGRQTVTRSRRVISGVQLLVEIRRSAAVAPLGVQRKVTQ